MRVSSLPAILLAPGTALVLAGSASAASQGLPPAPTHPVLQQRSTTAVVPVSAGCPVSLDVRYAQAGALRNAGRAESMAHPQYRLSFRPLLPGGLLHATVRLHGYTGSRLLPAATEVGANTPAPAPDFERFGLSFSGATNGDLFQSVVSTRKMHGVDWVELEELTFADGHRWTSAASGTCRVVPDGFQLVGTR